MIKENTIKKQTAPLQIGAADMRLVAEYFTRGNDAPRMECEEHIRALESAAHSCDRNIEDFERRAGDYRDDKQRYERDIENARVKLAAIPNGREFTAEEAQADIKRALALPYIKSITVQREGGLSYIVATTRTNSLFTTLARKFSRSERWYRVKPYTIALPAYTIRLRTIVSGSLSNGDGLTMRLAEYERDTAHFPEWISRYSNQPHAHWGTSSAGSDNRYRGICLGEYESDVSAAFRASIADGLIALATYLQASGAAHGYIHTRETWALIMGKQEYNAAMIPSQKEEVKLSADAEIAEDEDEDEPTPSCGDDRGTDCEDCQDEGCECDCHADHN